MMTITLNYTDHVCLADLKPIINNKGIFFPLSVDNGYIEEDGLSFGLPVDSGKYAIVTFEKAVGVLAEDTHALAQERNSKKVLNFHLLNFIEFRTVNGWDKELPEVEPDVLYDAWSVERKKAYSAAHELTEDDFSTDDLILEYQGQKLYKKDNEYYASCGESWCYGYVTPVEIVDGVSESMILDIVKSKKLLNEAEIARTNTINDNIKQLATVFGYSASNTR